MADSANTTDTPEIDRRMAIIGLAAGAATGMVIFEAVDPVLDAINAYRAALEDFNENAPSDDEGASSYAQQHFHPQVDALGKWSEPAKTKEGALAAMELALEEHGVNDNSPIETAMLRAVHGFLKT